MDKLKNTKRNIIYGSINKIIMLLCPFIIRSIIIKNLGMDYVGLGSLFTSILQVLSLAELGFGSAIVYSMYKPIAEDDADRICALMRLYRTYYRLIGLFIGTVGLCLTPFIPKLIKGSIPTGLNIYVLYLMNLGVTVLSYWLFAYRNCLFSAHQRIDVTSKIAIITDTIKYVCQLFANI